MGGRPRILSEKNYLDYLAGQEAHFSLLDKVAKGSRDSTATFIVSTSKIDYLSTGGCGLWMTESLVSRSTNHLAGGEIPQLESARRLGVINWGKKKKKADLFSE